MKMFRGIIGIIKRRNYSRKRLYGDKSKQFWALSTDHQPQKVVPTWFCAARSALRKLPSAKGWSTFPSRPFTINLTKSWTGPSNTQLQLYKQFQCCGAEILYFRLRLRLWPYFRLRLQLQPYIGTYVVNIQTNRTA